MTNVLCKMLYTIKLINVIRFHVNTEWNCFTYQSFVSNLLLKLPNFCHNFFTLKEKIRGKSIKNKSTIEFKILWPYYYTQHWQTRTFFSITRLNPASRDVSSCCNSSIVNPWISSPLICLCLIVLYLNIHHYHFNQ